MINSIEDSLNFLIDMKKMGSLNPGFLDDEILEFIGNGFDKEINGFWGNQIPSFQRELKREDEEKTEFFESSNLTVRDKSTWGFTGF